MTRKKKVHPIWLSDWLWRDAQKHWDVEDPTPQLKHLLERWYGEVRLAKQAGSEMGKEGSTECVDCSVCTITLGEDYMVYDDVWEQAGMNARSGMLCIGCLEDRLGRKLEASDFIDVPVNDPQDFSKSGRLRARLTQTRKGSVHRSDRNNVQESNPTAYVQLTKQQLNEYCDCLNNLAKSLIWAVEVLKETRAIASAFSGKLSEIEAELNSIGAASNWLRGNDPLNAFTRIIRKKLDLRGDATNLSGLRERETKTDEDPSVA